MTKKEIDAIISNDDILDMLLYLYCLSRCPEQFANIGYLPSECNNVKNQIIRLIKNGG